MASKLNFIMIGQPAIGLAIIGIFPFRVPSASGSEALPDQSALKAAEMWLKTGDERSAIETVTPMMNKDNRCRVSGYYIKL
jgi:hypothetical protein